MKQIVIWGLLAGLLTGTLTRPAQGQDAEQEVMAVVDGLFDAMRGADSAAVRAAFHPELEMIGSSGSREGVAGVAYGNVANFVQAVGSVEPGAFDERTGRSEIRIDDNLATVFTPYAFYHNGDLSHCGVDVFLIARVGEQWKIVGLVDTRRREGCEEWLK
jgi:hypothetical protein